MPEISLSLNSIGRSELKETLKRKDAILRSFWLNPLGYRWGGSRRSRASGWDPSRAVEAL